MSVMGFRGGSDRPNVLPGEDLIEAGIRDLHNRRETIEVFWLRLGRRVCDAWESSYLSSFPTILNIASMTCCQKTTPIQLIRGTMLSFVGWRVTHEQPNCFGELL